MASKSHQFSFFFALFLLTFSIPSTVGETISASHETLGRDRVEKIVKAISDAGYVSMSLTLGITLNILIRSINNTTKFTIFCPPDQAFFSLNYPQPPLTLLKYHIAPMKLDKEALAYLFSSSTLPIASAKIDTLLPGHPLVVIYPFRPTTATNFVKIAKWEIYNDGYVIVHGVEDFLNPAIQTLWYPRYNESTTTTTSTLTSEGRFIEGLILALKEGYNMIWMFALFIAVSCLAYPICVVFFGEEGCIRRRLGSRDDEYLQLLSSNDIVLDV